jgi:phosphatidylserine decarboxylase
MVITGIYYALGLIVAGLLMSWVTRSPYYGVPLYVLALFCLYFFRDPHREIPPGPVAVSPADGKVVAVKPEGSATRLSIFLNIFDVHVNRSPIGGTITDVQYQKGKFLVASREEASVQNEMNTVTVNGEEGRVVFKQIAGLIARRIVFYERPGERVEKGERIGLIKFGSRVDVLLGPEWEVTVRPGEHVLAGSSVVARRRSGI